MNGIDGVLANEGLARLGVSGLSSGTHLLTVSATDSSGASSSATVSIVVNDVNEAPTAVDDFTYWRVGGGEARADVLANDTDTERDINSHRLSLDPPMDGPVGMVRQHRRHHRQNELQSVCHMCER